MPECLRGELLTMGRYTNPASFTFTFTFTFFAVVLYMQYASNSTECVRNSIPVTTAQNFN